jgi:hypothetical protein
MQRVLRAVGAFPDNEVDTVAKALYESGTFTNDAYHLALVCFGREINGVLSATFPSVAQMLWDQALEFICTRFKKYRDQKVSHGQWDED